MEILETSLFQTESGYRSGEITFDHPDKYEVILTRDQYGNQISEETSIPKSRKVHPNRISRKTVWIHPSREFIAEGFVRVGEPFDTIESLGSGIVGTKRGRDQRYPIYNPLTLHGEEHKELLNSASSFLSQVVDQYLKTGKISGVILNQTCWLINSTLYIDDHELLTPESLIEAVLNFCYDYKEMPDGYLLRQPINYLFDIIAIDGIYSDSYCISFVPTDFEGITYNT